MLNFNSHQRGAARVAWSLSLLAAFVLVMTSMPVAQTTISTGSIVGTVTNPQDAAVDGARVTITDAATNRTISVTSNSSGAFNSGALLPGEYTVLVAAKGFSSVSQAITVRVGNTAAFNPKLQAGPESQIIKVQASNAQINNQQASVQGVVTASQIGTLPLNGRNFMDLAQLQPGVQIQDGTNFDPTKVGYSSLSFDSRSGRSGRIEIDGADISDETVGGTTQNIPASAIQEFQLSQSTLDLSTELTSSGSVNVTTKSGTNGYHGGAFGNFRDSSALAAHLPTPAGLQNPPFQRSQFGGNLGGAVIKDRLFFFADGERTLNNLQSPVSLPSPFQADSGFFNAPFRSTELDGRVDYNFNKGARLFYRYNYFDNLADATFFAGSFMVYGNKNNSRSQVIGLDFSTGSLNHSIRFEYLKFQNQITNADAGQPFSQSGLTLFNGPFSGGPNYLAPQSTPQSDHLIRYDGTKDIRNHTIRFGALFNHIQGGGFANFFSAAPVVSSAPNLLDANCQVVSAQCPAGPDGTTASNFLNYDVAAITLGNGIGFATPKAAFGFPAGGLGPDNRIAFYVGDNWKVRPGVTVSLGLRYERDTGRQDSDLPGIPVLNGIVTTFPNLGAPIRQPNLNFAPQVGIAWDPGKNGKTVLRAGAGVYYENTIWNNVLFDRPTREAQGAFLQTTAVCNGVGSPGPALAIPNGSIPVPDGVCGNGGNPITVGAASANILALEHTYQSSYPFTPTLPNGGYIGSLVAQGLGVGTNAAPLTFGPNFQTPRSFQLNAGFQHEIRRGMVLSLDYLRNVETHALLGIDVNHTGDAHFFNQAGAQAAIAQTIADCGASSLASALAAGGCTPLEPAAIGAQMSDFAARGLTATYELGAYNPSNPSPTSCPITGCAFWGVNHGVSSNLNFLLPISRSVYNAVDVKLVQSISTPLRTIKSANFQFSYSLSKFVNPGGANPSTQPANYQQGADQDFVIGAADNANPLRYMGPSTMDRRHQISFGGSFVLPKGFQAGIISHFYSPLSTPLVVPNSGLGDGEIFRTDFTGDGTTQDLVPGTKNGAFMRNVNPGNLVSVINSYNHTFAGQATPAGQELISTGLFTLQQLQQANGVAPILPAPVANAVGLAWLKDTDLSVGWKYVIKEKVTIQPGISLFNLFNFANFDLPPNVLSPYLTGRPGNVGGTNYAGTQNVRVGAGTGVYGLGSPRVAEFNLKITF